MKLNKTIKTMGLLTAATGLFLTSCADLPTDLVPGLIGGGKADVEGKVMKNATDPGKNATIALIDTVKSTEQLARTNGSGEYKFSNVSAAEYRVAFLLQSEAARRNKDSQFFEDNAQAEDFYGFVSTNSFEYKGDAEGVFKIPTFNVGWTSNISPADGSSTSATGSMNFSWSTADNVKNYNLEILNANFKTFYKSQPDTSTSVSWDKKGNDGTSIQPGETYYYRVNVLFNDTDEPIFPVQGGTALLKMNVN